MKLPGLIDLSLVLILASSSKGQNWSVTLVRTITTTPGSDVIIPCTFTVPLKHQTENAQIYWKKPERSSFNTFDNDQNAFVFHPNDTLKLEKYRGRTELIGDKAKGECTLKIHNIMDNEPSIYVRVLAKGDNYSFKQDFVSISVSGVATVSLKPDIFSQPLPTFDTTRSSTVGATQAPSAPTMYLAIFIPVAALLIIILVVGIFFCKKHKRPQPFIREESGYYANFSRAPTNQAKREASYEKQDNKKVSEVKVIDEPVYMNTQVQSGQKDHRMDHTENVYANVDYTK